MSRGCAASPLGFLSAARNAFQSRLVAQAPRGSKVPAPEAQRRSSWRSERRYIAHCRVAVEEYDLCQGSRLFDCSSLSCAWYLTSGALASILGVCPRHLPTRFTLTRAVQHAQKHFAPPLRALGRTQGVGRLAHSLEDQSYIPNRPHLVREDRRTHGSPISARSAD